MVGSNLVHPAVRSGDVQLVQDLLLLGASPTFMDENRDAPIHVAAKLGNLEVVKLLLREGLGYMNALDGQGRTPLHLAVENGYVPVVRALLSHGANLSIRCIYTHPYGEYRALDFAARAGHVDIMTALIEHGADVNAADSRDRTALHIAAIDNEARAIDVLVTAGADVEARTGSGRTPLLVASEPGRYEAALALLQHGAKIKVKSDSGNSPLHCAALCAGTVAGTTAIVDLLLRWGADETAVNSDGHTAAEVIGDYMEEGHAVPEEDVVPLEKLLASAPVDRAWRRRGFLVLCRAFPNRVCVEVHDSMPGSRTEAAVLVMRHPASTSRDKLARTRARGGSDSDGGVHGRDQSSGGDTREERSGDWRSVAVGLVGLKEEGLFRKIVGYL